MNVPREEMTVLSGIVIGAAQKVSGKLGTGFSEKVYENALVVELKVLERIERAHRLQCLNYLRASNQRLGLVLNFGKPHLEVGRIIWNP